MGALLESLTQLFTNNRRQHRRQRRKYDTIVRDEGWREVFHGKTLDVSRGGAKLRGFPRSKGVFDGQAVTVEFLLVPKDISAVAKRAPVRGRVVRVQEQDGETLLGIKFDQPLAGA
ncbi:MAG: PilZ domain-containing protein [Phycisphaerae bacterium]